MNDNPRALKLADRIKVIVATMLDTRVKDPRLGFVTITDVRVTAKSGGRSGDWSEPEPESESQAESGSQPEPGLEPDGSEPSVDDPREAP